MNVKLLVPKISAISLFCDIHAATILLCKLNLPTNKQTNKFKKKTTKIRTETCGWSICTQSNWAKFRMHVLQTNKTKTNFIYLRNSSSVSIIWSSSLSSPDRSSNCECDSVFCNLFRIKNHIHEIMTKDQEFDDVFFCIENKKTNKLNEWLIGIKDGVNKRIELTSQLVNRHLIRQHYYYDGMAFLVHRFS